MCNINKENNNKCFPGVCVYTDMLLSIELTSWSLCCLPAKGEKGARHSHLNSSGTNTSLALVPSLLLDPSTCDDANHETHL